MRCRTCSHEYTIRGGILSLLADADLHGESMLEMRKRDAKAVVVAQGREWSSRMSDRLETAPTLEALHPFDGAVVAEHGCGTGRYTMELANRAAAVVAVDFSRTSLDVLRIKLTVESQIALVQADVTRPHLAPRSFDRVLSTLHSNLPTSEHRLAALRQSAQALREQGRAVISMHHYGLRELIRLQPQSGRYADSGIYRYFMRTSEARREIAQVFRQVHFEYLRASLPAVPSTILPKILGAVPLVRGALAQLLIALCEQPL